MKGSHHASRPDINDPQIVLLARRFWAFLQPTDHFPQCLRPFLKIGPDPRLGPMLLEAHGSPNRARASPPMNEKV